MRKTLEQLLNEKKYQKVNIKVGSKSGSSFWYCGKGDITFSLPEIRQARHKLLKQVQHTYKQLQDRLNNLDAIYDKTLELAKKKKIKDFDKYEKELNKKRERERVSLPKKLISLEYDIAITLLERPVLEIIEGISLDEKPCYIIYIKGNEKGAYWTIKEYNKRHSKVGVEIL